MTAQRLTPADLAAIRARLINLMSPDVGRLCAELEAAWADAERRAGAVVRFLAADGHDLCHENRRELAAAFGLEPSEPCLPPEGEFALRCIRYRQELYGPDGPGSETEAWEQRVADLEAALARLEARRDRLAGAVRALLAACRHDSDGLGPRVLGAMDEAERALAEGEG